MLQYLETIRGIDEETLYEDFELEYAMSHMAEEYWNSRSCRQRIVNECDKTVYVMYESDFITSNYKGYNIVVV